MKFRPLVLFTHGQQPLGRPGISLFTLPYADHSPPVSGSRENLAEDPGPIWVPFATDTVRPLLCDMSSRMLSTVVRDVSSLTRRQPLGKPPGPTLAIFTLTAFGSALMCTGAPRTQGDRQRLLPFMD